MVQILNDFVVGYSIRMATVGAYICRSQPTSLEIDLMGEGAGEASRLHPTPQHLGG